MCLFKMDIYVLVSLAQLVETMHKICKVEVRTPDTTKKKGYICYL